MPDEFLLWKCGSFVSIFFILIPSVLTFPILNGIGRLFWRFQLQPELDYYTHPIQPHSEHIYSSTYLEIFENFKAQLGSVVQDYL